MWVGHVVVGGPEHVLVAGCLVYQALFEAGQGGGRPSCSRGWPSRARRGCHESVPRVGLLQLAAAEKDAGAHCLAFVCSKPFAWKHRGRPGRQARRRHGCRRGGKAWVQEGPIASGRRAAGRCGPAWAIGGVPASEQRSCALQDLGPGSSSSSQLQADSRGAAVHDDMLQLQLRFTQPQLRRELGLPQSAGAAEVVDRLLEEWSRARESAHAGAGQAPPRSYYSPAGSGSRLSSDTLEAGGYSPQLFDPSTPGSTGQARRVPPPCPTTPPSAPREVNGLIMQSIDNPIFCHATPGAAVAQQLPDSHDWDVYGPRTSASGRTLEGVCLPQPANDSARQGLRRSTVSSAGGVPDVPAPPAARQLADSGAHVLAPTPPDHLVVVVAGQPVPHAYLEVLQQQVAGLQAELQQAIAASDQLSGDLEAARKQVQELQEELAAANAAVEGLAAAKMWLAEEAMSLRDEVVAKRATIEELGAAKARLQADQEVAIAQLQAELEDANAAIDSLAASKNWMTDEAVSLRDEVLDKRRVVKDLTAAKSQLEADLKAAKAAADSLATSNAELAAGSLALTQQLQDLSLAAASGAEAAAAAAGMQARGRSSSTVGPPAPHTPPVLHYMLQRMADEQAMLAVGSAMAELAAEDAQQRHDLVVGQLSAAQVVQLQADLHAATSAVTRLQGELAAATTAKAQLERRAELQQEELGAVTAAKVQLERRVEQQQQELVRCGQEHEAAALLLQDRCGDVEQQLRTVQAELQESDLLVSELRDYMSGVARDLAVYEATVAELEAVTAGILGAKAAAGKTHNFQTLVDV